MSPIRNERKTTIQWERTEEEKTMIIPNNDAADIEIERGINNIPTIKPLTKNEF